MNLHFLFLISLLSMTTLSHADFFLLEADGLGRTREQAKDKAFEKFLDKIETFVEEIHPG